MFFGALTEVYLRIVPIWTAQSHNLLTTPCILAEVKLTTSEDIPGQTPGAELAFTLCSCVQMDVKKHL